MKINYGKVSIFVAVIFALWGPPVFCEDEASRTARLANEKTVLESEKIALEIKNAKINQDWTNVEKFNSLNNPAIGKDDDTLLFHQNAMATRAFLDAFPTLFQSLFKDTGFKSVFITSDFSSLKRRLSLLSLFNLKADIAICDLKGASKAFFEKKTQIDKAILSGEEFLKSFESKKTLKGFAGPEVNTLEAGPAGGVLEILQGISIVRSLFNNDNTLSGRPIPLEGNWLLAAGTYIRSIGMNAEMEPDVITPEDFNLRKYSNFSNKLFEFDVENPLTSSFTVDLVSRTLFFLHLKNDSFAELKEAIKYSETRDKLLKRFSDLKTKLESETKICHKTKVEALKDQISAVSSAQQEFARKVNPIKVFEEKISQIKAFGDDLLKGTDTIEMMKTDLAYRRWLDLNSTHLDDCAILEISVSCFGGYERISRTFLTRQPHRKYSGCFIFKAFAYRKFNDGIPFRYLVQSQRTPYQVFNAKHSTPVISDLPKKTEKKMGNN